MSFQQCIEKAKQIVSKDALQPEEYCALVADFARELFDAGVVV